MMYILYSILVLWVADLTNEDNGTNSLSYNNKFAQFQGGGKSYTRTDPFRLDSITVSKFIMIFL